MGQPIPVVITDINGNLISVSGATLGVFAAAAVPGMPSDVNGNPLTLSGATSGSQVAGTVPIVICDARGYQYNLPIVATSNSSTILNITSALQGSGFRGNPVPVCLTDTNGNALSISGATTGNFIAAPLSVVLSDYRGYPITLTLSSTGPLYLITTFAGNGTQGYAGDGSSNLVSAEFNCPAGIAFDSTGNIYIADSQGNGRIRAVNMQGTTQTLFGTSIGSGVIQTVAGTGTNSYTGDGGAATSATFGHPCYIAFDGSGNMYIADQQNGSIRKITTGGTVTTVVGGAQGHGGLGIGLLGDNIPNFFVVTSCGNASGGNTTYNGTFSAAAATAGGHIYIQGFSTAANNGFFTVQSGSTSGALILNNASGIAQTQAAQAFGSQLYTPQAVYVDASGNIWVADTNNDLIRVVNMQGTTQTFLGTSIAAGNIAAVAGIPGVTGIPKPGFSGDGGPATSAKIAWPIGFGFDGSGNLYFCDFYNHAIRKITNAGTISTVAGQQTALSISAVANSASTSTYTYTRTSGPALALPASGSLQIYISGCTTTANNGTFFVTGLGTGTFNVTNASGVTESESGATAICGVPGYAGDGGAATSAQLYFPQDIKIDATGNLYIAEEGNNVIRKVTPGGTISTFAGDFAVYGTTGGYAGDNGPATLAGMGKVAIGGPLGLGLTTDGSGNPLLYVSDFGNCVVRKVFADLLPAPAVTSVSANNGPQGGGTTVTITGTGFITVPAFGTGSTVTFNGAAATSIVVNSPTSITCITPASATTGLATIVVTNPDGQTGTNSTAYTYNLSITLIASGIAGLHGTGAQTSPLSLNTTGASLLVAVVAAFNAQGTITDSLSNTWNALTTYNSAASLPERLTIYYAFSHAGGALATGSGHTFTVGGSADASVSVFAVNNTLTTSSVFGVATGTAGPLSSPFQPGSITPTLGDVVVTGFCNNTGVTSCSIAGAGSDTGWSTPLRLVNGSDGGSGASILLYASGSALNPTWTTSSGNYSSAIASFKIV